MKYVDLETTSNMGHYESSIHSLSCCSNKLTIRLIQVGSDLPLSLKCQIDCIYTMYIHICSTHYSFQLNLEVGIYADLIEEWQMVFLKKQIHIVSLNELSNNMEKGVNGVFKFLSLGRYKTCRYYHGKTVFISSIRELL